MNQSLAKPISAYVDASNAFDTTAVLATFKDDAIVNDVQREFWGKEAIRAWIDKELVGARAKIKVVKFVARYGDVVLTANVGRESDSGSVPNPLTLTFYFNVRDGKISQLIILQNK
jgi:hypothetical protein